LLSWLCGDLRTVAPHCGGPNEACDRQNNLPRAFHFATCEPVCSNCCLLRKLGPVQPSDSLAAVSGEHPLSPAARGTLVVAAAATIVLFYAASLASLALLALLIAVFFLATLGAARFGLGAAVGKKMALPARMFWLFARSLWLPTEPVYRLPLKRADAPRLFEMVDDLARRTRVPAPDHISIEMNCGAWVVLGGFAPGSGKTSLGVGYDLLAGLTTREIESVFAHEMSHARQVQRGFSRWLKKGLARLARTARELSTCAAERRGIGEPSAMVDEAEKVFGGLTTRAVRLVATYSRQDEFDADRGAVDLCGSAAMRSALTRLEILDRVLGRLPWNERVARLQSSERFSQWLVDEIESMTGAEHGEIARHAIDPYSTHPSLHDRLAMLSPGTAPLGESRPGIDLLADPDGIAMRLATEIQRGILAQEEKHTKAIARATKKLSKVTNFRGSRAAVFTALTLGVWLIYVGTVDGFAPDILVMSIVMLLSGAVIFRVGGYRDRIPLPVPAYGTFTTRTPQWETPEQCMAAEKAVVAEIQRAAGEIGERRDRIEWLVSAAYAALAKCDYFRAHVAARLALKIDGKSIEAALAYSIAAAGLGNVEQTQRTLTAVKGAVGFRTVATKWAAAWALTMLNDWNAEGFLAQLCVLDPHVATYAALLAHAQASRNKLQSAIRNGEVACSLDPNNVRCAQLLADIYLQAGRVRDAAARMEPLHEWARTDEHGAFLMTRVALMQHDLAAAADWGSVLITISPDRQWLIALAQAFGAARVEDQAARYFTDALTTPYWPEANVGLAHIATVRKNSDAARRHLFAALKFEGASFTSGQSMASVFQQILVRLVALDERRQVCKSWIAKIPSRSHSPLADVSLLVCATDRTEAETHLRTIVDAMQDGGRPINMASVQWRDAPQEHQPVRPVQPGVRYIVT
jgi:Zn-dependent protease with chaperone function